MGLFDKFLGRNKGESTANLMAQNLATEEAESARAEQDKADAFKRKQEEERNALKKRSETMQGGGRAGLMFGGNQGGVA